MKAVVAGYIAAALALTPEAAKPAPADLCASDETPVFSCLAGSGVVSVCAPKAAGGHGLKYRYGKPEKIERELPGAGGSVEGGTVTYSGGGAAFVRFKADGYRYTAFIAIGRWSRTLGRASVKGVFVERAGKVVAALACKTDPGDGLGAELFRKLAIPTRSNADADFQIPDQMFPK